MNFLKYKTNNTYNTNTLSLEEYHRICPSVHHLSLTRLAPVMLSFARVHNWFQRVPSFDRLQTRQDEAVPFQFQVRSVPCTVFEQTRWISMDWIHQGAWRIHTLWYPCQHALNSFQLFFWKPLPIFSNRKGNKVPHVPGSYLTELGSMEDMPLAAASSSFNDSTMMLSRVKT